MSDSSNGPSPGLGRGLVIALASGFGTGYAPVASGTFGTLVGIPLAWWLAPLGKASWCAAAVALTLFACWIAGRAEGVFGEKDSGKIVIDEVAGYVIAMAFVPATAAHLIAAFFLFRLFDVLKPPPARHWERTLPGGFGVVMDDIAAGVWANLAHRLLWLVWAWIAG